MRKKKTPLALFVLLTFLGVYSNILISQEKVKETPLKGFPDASLTIFPLTFFSAGMPDLNQEHREWLDAYKRHFYENARQIARINLGLLLEEKGYDKFEMTDTTFLLPEEKAERKERAAAFGKFVSELDLKTDYALCTEFNLFAGKSGLYVYSVIVDAKGHVVWRDNQEQYGGTVFGCLEVACNRLVPVMGLDKLPEKELAVDKKLALREMRAKEPPSMSEFAAMDERLKTMKKAGASARVLVYPARVGGDHTDQTCATHLMELLNEARLCQATMVKTGPLLEAAGWPNEMQVLWLFARTVKEYVQEHPAESDYVLFTDYWFNPRGEVWAVHFIVCDRAGDWVIVDLQNSQQEDFQRVNPKTLADCGRLVVERLKKSLL